MERFFIYARKSTDDTNRQVLSIEAQLHELRELARKESLKVVCELVEAQTAKEPGRPLFNSMMSRIESGEAHGILAWHPDRLARNSVDGGRIIYLIDIGKLLWLKFPTFWFEPTPQGKFMLNIAFGQSKYYVDNMGENIRRGCRAKARKGIWPQFAPIGYLNDKEKRTIYPDPLKASLVRKTFELYSTGRYSLQEIAETMHSVGLSSRSNRGKLSASNIHYMLRNPVYYGLIRWCGEDFEGIHEPIVSKDLFNRAQRILAERKRASKRKPVKFFIFRGLFRCGECGASITAETQKGHNYYHCTKRKGPCFQHFIREESLQVQVLAEAKRLVIPKDWADKMSVLAEHEQDEMVLSSADSIKNLRNQMTSTEDLLDKLLDGYLKGETSREEYQRRRSGLVDAKIELRARLDTLENKGNDWQAQLVNFINWSSDLRKDIDSQDWRALANALQISSSSRILSDRKIRIDYMTPYSFVVTSQAHGDLADGSTEATACEDWNDIYKKVRDYFLQKNLSAQR